MTIANTSSSIKRYQFERQIKKLSSQIKKHGFQKNYDRLELDYEQ